MKYWQESIPATTRPRCFRPKRNWPRPEPDCLTNLPARSRRVATGSACTVKAARPAIWFCACRRSLRPKPPFKPPRPASCALVATLERTEITLPYAGLVRNRQVDLGQYVTPGAVLGVTFSVATAEVRLPLSNNDLAYLELPAAGRNDTWQPPVRLYGTVAGQRGEWQGRVVRTEGVVDENTRLSYAVVAVADPYGLLDRQRPVPLQIGTFVQAEVQGRDASGLVILPRAALRQGDTVYLADADSKLEIRPVEVIRATPDRVYIQNNISEGEQVITTAIQAPVPGLSVRLRETPSIEPELRVLPAAETGCR